MPAGNRLWHRAALLAIAILLLVMFSSFTAPTLLLLSLGIVLVLFSSLAKNRSMGMLAIVLLGIETSLSLSTESILEIRMLLSAILGIFLPLFMIGTILFDPMAELGKGKLSSRRHLYLTLTIIFVCILSLPIAAFLMTALSLPTIMHVSALLEISILLMTVVIFGSLASMVKPRRRLARSEIKETS